MDNFLSGKPVSTGLVWKSVGYGVGLQKTPSRVLESVGFRAALEEFGLTEELITTALVSDINEKPKQRTQELKLGAEILGMVKREEPQQSTNKNTYNFIFSPEVQKKVKIIDGDIKKLLTQPQDVQKD